MLYFIFILRKCFRGQLTEKCRQNKNKIKYIVVFDWNQKLFCCTAWSDGRQNCSPATALRADSPVSHLSWRRCRQCRRWLLWIWRFCFQPFSPHSPWLACHSNLYTKWQTFIALLRTITVFEACIFPILLPAVVPTRRHCETCPIDVRKH